MGTKTIRVAVAPAMLRWARERAGLSLATLKESFPQIEAWESGEARPTLKQLERFAKKTHVPFGMLFMESPPDEALPIADFRTLRGTRRRPSPNLLETIYICQQRQAWYRAHLQTMGYAPLPFVATASLTDDPLAIAADIRRRLHFEVAERSSLPTWSEALRHFIEQVELVGILVMASGIVGNNTHRKLNPDEFRGFTLVDDIAPLVFINTADTKAAQIFTLAHELAHVWLGQSGVSDADVASFPQLDVERWCNQVAAELLVPRDDLQMMYDPDADLTAELDRLARQFKVSTLVILRRVYESGLLDRETFRQTYEATLARLRQIERRGSGGGSFYRTLNVRVSKPFAQAIVTSALEGQTLFREAFQLLGIRRQETFRKFAQELGEVRDVVHHSDRRGYIPLVTIVESWRNTQ